jgi:hypothetical protein
LTLGAADSAGRHPPRGVQDHAYRCEAGTVMPGWRAVLAGTRMGLRS